MSFFRMCPRDYTYNSYIFDDIPLKVIQDSGVEIDPDFSVEVTDLNGGYKHFKTYNGKGTSFKISAIIFRKDTAQGWKVTGTGSRDITETNYVEVEIDGEMMTFEDTAVTGVEIYSIYQYLNKNLNTMISYFMQKGIPFMLTTDILGIDTSVPYLITDTKLKQSHRDYIVREFTFTKWNELNYSTFSKTNNGITKAIKKMKANKKKKAQAKAKAKTSVKNKLAKCKRKVLVYSKKQKTVDCVKTLQTILYQNKFLKKNQIDGWYGKVTYNAVKKYQAKYAKKYGLKKTGKIDKATYNVMIGKGKLLTKSKTNKANNSPKAIKTINIKSGTKSVQSAQSISKKDIGKGGIVLK